MSPERLDREQYNGDLVAITTGSGVRALEAWASSASLPLSHGMGHTLASQSGLQPLAGKVVHKQRSKQNAVSSQWLHTAAPGWPSEEALSGW